MIEHPYGIWILLPAVVAFAIAIVTRRTVLSLILGIYAGALLMAGGNPFVAIYQTWETHLWPTLIDPGKLRVFSFTILMGAMVGVVTISGGMRSLIRSLMPVASNRRRGQLATWLMGNVVFFDDYASIILLGSTFGSLCDRLRISRAKLAYIVDSTAAPTASIAIVSTWIAVEIDYIHDGLIASGQDGALAFETFVYSIPYRFYVITSLLLVPITVIMQRDFGSMHTAERDCIASTHDEHDPVVDTESDPKADRWYAWTFAVVPIIVLLSVVMIALYVTGLRSLAESSANELASDQNSFARFRSIIGAASSSVSLQYGAIVGLATSILLPWSMRAMPLAKLSEGAVSGIRIVLPAVAVLWTASTLSRMTTNRSVSGDVQTTPYEFQDHRLYAAEYLTGFLTSTEKPPDGPSSENDGVQRGLALSLAPTIAFLTASFVAFCTGTSYGTMGILLPMLIPIVCGMLSINGTLSLSDPILLVTIGSVLAGAVFGDHCSPISDTTILSSQSAGCDHLTHVWTQVPYATLAASVSVLLGTLPIGFGVSVWILLPLQILALIALTQLLGRGHDEPIEQPNP